MYLLHRQFLLLSTLVMVIALPSQVYSQASSRQSVVATASMISDMTKNIAGELLDIKTVVPIGGDPHIYEPTPGDAQMIANADLILKNGLTF